MTYSPKRKRKKCPTSGERLNRYEIFDELTTVSARAGNRSGRVSWYAQFTRVRSPNSSTPLRRTPTSSTVSPPVPTIVADPKQSADSEQIRVATIALHHRVGKYTKSSGSLGLSTANTLSPCGSAISSCGLTSIAAIAATAFDKGCK